MPTYDTATMDIARIDEEIIRQKATLFNLYAQRNSLSFIFRLPTEILEIVFIHRARDYHDHSSDIGHLTPTAPSWVNVSYVCRHWREVALNCPTLWTHIFMTSQRWTEELLARSKQGSLKLHVNTGCRVLHLVEQVMDHVERIQELRLDLPTLHSHEILFTLSSCAPHLQTLKISMSGNPSGWPYPLFDGATPALRTLELTDCPVPLNSFKLSGLTTLSLHYVPVRFQQSMMEFLAMLSCMPDLIHLYLEDALAGAPGLLSSPAFNVSKKIHLPRLSRLWITAPLSTVIALLSCVSVPLKTQVRLECDSERDSSPDAYAPLCSLLARRLSMFKNQEPCRQTILSLAIEFSAKAKITFSASERDCNPSVSELYADWHWGCNIPLQVILGRGSSTVESIISDLSPLTNFQSVHLHCYPPFSSAFWRELLGRFQGLRYLKLSQGYMPDLASVFALTPHDCTENYGALADRGPNRIFAPALEVLELHNIIFRTGLPKGGVDTTFAADVRSLCDALSTRKESRGRLVMTWCIERDLPGKYFNMDGWWGGGRFHVVDKHNSDAS